MTVMDELTKTERDLIVAALECAPTQDAQDQEHTYSYVAAEHDTLERLAVRIREGAFTDELEKFGRTLQATADRQVQSALVSQIDVLTTMCDSFAGALGRIAAMWADQGEAPNAVEAAQQALVLWQEAKSHVGKLLEAVQGDS